MDLSDYGGSLLPDLQPEHFSREALIEMVKTYSGLYAGLDAFWYLAVKEKAGNDLALACDILAWHRTTKYEMSRLTKRFNITGNDVIAVMKGWQLTPWYWSLKTDIKIESPERAIMTILQCPTLDALEKEGTGREQQICNDVEPAVFARYAAYFNPAIKVKCLKSAPRRDRNGIACQWEFKLERTATS